MADDKKNRGKQDRALVAAGQEYEVDYFARKHGLDLDAARRIIQEHGPSRRACDKAARLLLHQEAADRGTPPPPEPASA